MGLAQGTELRNDTRRSRASYPDRSSARCLGGLFCSLAQRASFCGVDQPGPWHDLCDGANRGAPQALQIADRWHVIHNLGEALEKVLARHHADLKRALTPEEEHQVTTVLDQQALAHLTVRSQAEQL